MLEYETTYVTNRLCKCWFCDIVCHNVGLCDNCKFERIVKKKIIKAKFIKIFNNFKKINNLD